MKVMIPMWKGNLHESKLPIVIKCCMILVSDVSDDA